MNALRLARLDSQAEGFWKELKDLVFWESAPGQRVEETVRKIIADVRRRGDAALVDYTNRWDERSVAHGSELTLPSEELERAYATIDATERDALEEAARRIQSYHEHQRQDSWSYRDQDGTLVGQRVMPIGRVGLYVPGGKAAYPSTVLMNAIPARVAGVGEIVMTVPTPRGELSALVLAAAHLAGIEQVHTVGGAQAIAALAYGTETVVRVDKIVGPGNAFVAAAKRLVFGAVGIDMVAGPSEILVVCDGRTPADWTALDLFSQAEHDEEAQALLVCPSEAYLDEVEKHIGKLLPRMERSAIIRQALASRGALIRVRDLAEAVEVANVVAPEHLVLSVERPDEMLDSVKHAGAIFLGRHTPEAIGDYCAGPNHVLPTGRTARFSSPLGVYDFQTRSSVIKCSESSVQHLAGVAARLARGEGLYAHALSAECRTAAGREET
jgi:histidinol dehydrogenase